MKRKTGYSLCTIVALAAMWGSAAWAQSNILFQRTNVNPCEVTGIVYATGPYGGQDEDQYNNWDGDPLGAELAAAVSGGGSVIWLGQALSSLGYNATGYAPYVNAENSAIGGANGYTCSVYGNNEGLASAGSHVTLSILWPTGVTKGKLTVDLSVQNKAWNVNDPWAQCRAEAFGCAAYFVDGELRVVGPGIDFTTDSGGTATSGHAVITVNISNGTTAGYIYAGGKQGGGVYGWQNLMFDQSEAATVSLVGIPSNSPLGPVEAKLWPGYNGEEPDEEEQPIDLLDN